MKLQTDGDLVLYQSSNPNEQHPEDSLFCTLTSNISGAGPPYHLYMMSNGLLTINDTKNNIIWNSKVRNYNANFKTIFKVN